MDILHLWFKVDKTLKTEKDQLLFPFIVLD